MEVVERLADEPVDLLEINISCPNVKEGGIAFGQDPKAVEAITKAVKEKAKAAGYHETEPQCDRHRRDGKSSGSRRRGCDFSDQHPDGHEDRYRPAVPLPWPIKPAACPARR